MLNIVKFSLCPSPGYATLCNGTCQDLAFSYSEIMPTLTFLGSITLGGLSWINIILECNSCLRLTPALKNETHLGDVYSMPVYFTYAFFGCLLIWNTSLRCLLLNVRYL